MRVKSITVMAESKFSRFQVQVKPVFSHTIELDQTALCVATEKQNAVDMSLPNRKLILTMVHPKVPIKPGVDQTIVPR